MLNRFVKERHELIRECYWFGYNERVMRLQNLPKCRPRFQILRKTTSGGQKLRLRFQIRTSNLQTPFG